MSWTWRSCDGAECADIVFAASFNPVSAEGYRFSDPDHEKVIESFRRTFAAMRALPCDILVTAHPGQADEGAAPGEACRAYADAHESRLNARLAEEQPRSAH